MTKTTRCPKCETTFRVTDAQLQAAKGKVRCGSCLNVFKAADHWVGGAAAAPTPTSPPASNKPAGKTPAGKFQFDQSAIDGSSAEKVLTKPAIPTVNTMGEIRAVKVEKPLVKDDDDEYGLISDDEDDVVKVADTATNDAVTDEELSDLFVNLDDLDGGTEDRFNTTSDLEAVDSISAGTARKKTAKAADESWAKDLLQGEQDDSKERDEHVKKIFSAGLKDNIFTDDGHVRKKQEDARDGFISGNRVDVMQDLGLNAPPAPKAILNRKEMVSKIEPAPVEIEWKHSGRDWIAVAIWSSLNLLVIICLVVQYYWINFENLSRDQQYRPMYAKACETLGCTLPDMFNPAVIRSYNLVVRTDPQTSGVLVVDAILQNDASYPQPFPDLELYFSDLDNFPVASRRFTSAEYLQGEMAGKTMMPPAKSIHLSLRILDPGSKAVNYRLQISDQKPVNS